MTLIAPAVAIRLAGTAADSCEALTKVVVSEAAPQLTVVDEVKLAPLTISVKAAPPAVADAGLRLVMEVGGKMMVKAALLEAPLTVTLIAPAVAIRLAGTSAINCDALTKVVASGAAPQLTVASEVKSAPLTISVKAALPAVTDAGFRLVMDGVGATTPNGTPYEPPRTALTLKLLALANAEAAMPPAIDEAGLSLLVVDEGGLTGSGSWGEATAAASTGLGETSDTFCAAL